MVNQRKWRMLQLFAGEGTSAPGSEGGNAPTGEDAADAGHRHLRELGVPENRIRKNRAYQVCDFVLKNTEEKPTAEQDAAAQEQMPGKETQPRLSWEEIKKDPEYNAEIQKIIQARLREEGQNKAILQTLDPALKALAREHGLDPENLDPAALARAVTGNNLDRMPQSGEHSRQQAIQRQRIQNHIRNLELQGQSLRNTFPGFDLRTEMRNPVFARLVSPGVGLSVEDAYHTVHRREIQAASMQVAAQQMARQIAGAIQSGSRRPDESGGAAQAPSVTTFDYRKASRAEREALKQRLRQAAARGEKVYPE